MAEIIADTFVRSDAANLGANWTVISGMQNISIVSNKASINSGVSGQNYGGVFTGASWTGGNDQYAEMTYDAETSGDDGGALCRGTSAADTGYLADINNNDAVALGGLMHIDLFIINPAGTFTTVVTGATGTVVAGDVVRCETEGSTIRFKLNGVQKLSGSNSTITTGKPGIRQWHGTASANTTRYTLFAAGDFAAAGPPIDYSQPYVKVRRIPIQQQTMM